MVRPCFWLLLLSWLSAPAFATALAPGVHWVQGTYAPPRQPDGNSVLFETPGGWLVVDSGRHPAHARAVLAAAHGRPLRALLNTHWHLDHVGGNPALRAAAPDLRVYASPAIDGALGGFLADYAAQLRTLLAREPGAAAAADWRAELARIERGDALRPDRKLRGDTVLVVGGREFRVGFAAAATEGDLWVFDAASGVLAAGDLVTLPAPFFDTACPERWRAALDRLEATPFTRLVPGHGAPMDRAGFAAWRKAFGRLLDCAASDTPEAGCIAGWQADAQSLLPDAAARQQAAELLAYYLPAVLRNPATANRCRVPAPAA